MYFGVAKKVYFRNIDEEREYAFIGFKTLFYGYWVPERKSDIFYEFKADEQILKLVQPLEYIEYFDV